MRDVPALKPSTAVRERLAAPRNDVIA